VVAHARIQATPCLPHKSDRAPRPTGAGPKGHNKDEGKGKGQQAAKKLAELQRTVEELIGQGKIRPPATTQIRQAVAQLGQAVQQAG
jgi:hypothetical protein